MKQSIVLLLMTTLCGLSFAQSHQRTELGVKAQAGQDMIEIDFYSPGIVRVIKYPLNKPHRVESLSVVKQPESTALDLSATGELVRLSSSVIHIDLNLQTGSVVFYDRENTRLLAEKDHSASFFPNVQQAFLLDRQEAVYGLGQQQTGSMNRRNDTILLQQVNTKIAIPFFQSIKGYGLFWDNYSTTRYTGDAEGVSFSSDEGGAVVYYFMYGGTMDGTVACMRDLTGQSPLFPLWTWGYWQSKERYASQEEIVETVRKYRELKVPLDGIVQDWQYWSTDNAHWNGIEFGNPEFPDPPRMVSDIHQLNAHVIISVWPCFGPKTKPYRLLKEKGMLLDFETFPQPDSVRMYDAFDPEARAIYWDFMNTYLFSIGIDGWWLDATEGEYTRITESQLRQPTALGPFNTVANAFPLMTVGGVYDHQRKAGDDKRVFILTRSAFAGQQRYGANSWSGDIDGDWDTFRKQIPEGLNFSLCAIPYWNTDIGGFWVRERHHSHADYRELYVRWLQFGAFMPMMRSHGTNTPREIWQFGKKGEWAYDAIEKYIRLRYRLLPYSYSLSWEVTSNAGSVMRMLSMDFPQDKNVHELGSQYMYGRSLLVVPVTRSLYVKGEKENSEANVEEVKAFPVYLPEGVAWFDFWTDEKLEGGQSIQRDVPVDIMPVYVKAGSLIPFGPDVQYAGEKDWKELDLKIYPGADAEFVLYEDETDNYNYEKGMYSTIQMVWNDSDRTFVIEDRTGDFPGMIEERYFNVSVAGSDKTKRIRYNGHAVRVYM